MWWWGHDYKVLSSLTHHFVRPTRPLWCVDRNPTHFVQSPVIIRGPNRQMVIPHTCMHDAFSQFLSFISFIHPFSTTNIGPLDHRIYSPINLTFTRSCMLFQRPSFSFYCFASFAFRPTQCHILILLLSNGKEMTSLQCPCGDRYGRMKYIKNSWALHDCMDAIITKYKEDLIRQFALLLIEVNNVKVTERLKEVHFYNTRMMV